VDLAHRRGKEVDNALVRHGHHALPVDLDDPMAHAHPAPLSNAAAQQAADLKCTYYVACYLVGMLYGVSLATRFTLNVTKCPFDKKN